MADLFLEDSSTVLMHMENGAHCVVQNNFNIPDEVAKWRLEFFGDHGRLMGDMVIGQEDGGTLDALFMEEVRSYDAQQSKKEIVGEPIHVQFGNCYAREIASFSNSILTGTPVEVPGSDAVQVQRVMEAAYKASREKRTVDV